ncbi:MAG: hypothetical protein AAB963_02700 [Patescibacteria group bacterium]
MSEDLDLESGDMSRLNIPWHKKLILKFFPLQPLSGNDGRGFIIFVDNKISFWFFQDGDHFKYDGFEMGEYGDGNVQVFDNATDDRRSF